MAWIRSYGCVTAAGDSVADLWRALGAGHDCSCPWPADPTLRAFMFLNRPNLTSTRALLLDKMLRAYHQIRPELQFGARLGIIFASTKGFSDDFIWQAEAPELAEDPLTPLLNDFLKTTELKPERRLAVSNACSSSLAALALAQHWLKQGLDQVLVMAADAVTPFVIKGFQSLKLISPGPVTPFGDGRRGFYLGEAAAAILVNAVSTASAIRLYPVGLDTEGSAVTRPSSSGESLVRAAARVEGLSENPPDGIVAHGTGTLINDATEDLTFARIFSHRPWITGTKWCVGHTLATSGALDLIAACEALRQQQVFRLETTAKVDPAFHGRYLLKGCAEIPPPFRRVFLSSLGFGGMHASAMVERVGI